MNSTRFLSRNVMAARRGMSLLELMLVLALLVIIGSLALPAFQSTFASQRLLKAGEKVRIVWSKARYRAMKTGQIQQFRYEADGSGFSVEPYATDQDWLEADLETTQQLGMTGANGGQAVAPPVAALEPLTDAKKQLPEGVIFAGATVEMNSRLMQLQEEMTGRATPNADSTVPVLFYPDGTSSNTRLLLANDQQFYVLISLRGLTGIARVSDLLTQDDVSQLQFQ